MIAPPLVEAAALPARLASDGWAAIDRATLRRATGLPDEALAAWAPLWQALPPDTHLRDGGRYRRRRHGNCIVEGDLVRAVPHRAHWQPLDYNALHGGIERWFEPLPPGLADDPRWHALLAGLARVADAIRPAGPPAAAPAGARPAPWFVESHLFRIDTEGGIGRPTPEGAHRDGVDLVVVILVARHGVKGGETRVFDARGPEGRRFTLAEPWSALLLDDARMIHETTPIQPIEPGQPGWRDTLVLTYRRDGFQGPAEPRPAAAAGLGAEAAR